MMITEAGRAMTAHHAMMVVNVSEVEQAPDGAVPEARKKRAAGHQASARVLVRSIDSRTAQSSCSILKHSTFLSEGQATVILSDKLRLGRAARKLDDMFLRDRTCRVRRTV